VVVRLAAVVGMELGRELCSSRRAPAAVWWLSSGSGGESREERGPTFPCPLAGEDNEGALR